MLGGVDAEFAEEADSLPVEEAEDGVELVDSLFGVFSIDGFVDDSLSSAMPFSSGTTSGNDFSAGSTLLLTLAFSAAETWVAMSSPVFDLSLPLSLSTTVDTFSFPF